MKARSMFKAIVAVGVASACALSLAGCGNSTTSYTGGVAATVNGVEIPEDEVTAQIESIRGQMGLTDKDPWGQWLVSAGYTPESVREEVLEGLISEELIRQGAADAGISYTDEEVDQYLQSMKANYENDQQWQQALASIGMTEDEYREQLGLSLLSTRFRDTFSEENQASDEELLAYAQSHISNYDGAKRSSHILFDASDSETAQQVLDQINSGELAFEDAVAQYSKDAGSAANNGDVGWDALNSFVTEYTDGLSGLEVGQVSALVTSDYGIHIIKCTDVFNAPEQLTSLRQIPTEILEQLRSYLNSNLLTTAFNEWLENQRQSVDIVIEEIPEGVPYYVDLTQYQTADEGEDAATDGEATDDAATDSADAESTDAEGGETSGEGEASSDAQ